MHRRPPLWLIFSSALALICQSSCAPIAALRETRVTYVSTAQVDVHIKSAGESLGDAGKCAKKDPDRAIQHYLAAVKVAEARLRSYPKDEDARKLYKFALQRLFSVVRMHQMDPWTKPMQFGEYTLVHKADARPGWNPSLYEFLPDDQLEVGGKYLKERVTRDGVGATLVAISKHENPEYGENFAMGPKVYYGVTAIARFQGNRCEIRFYDPLDVDDVELAGRVRPLAADFTTSLAVMLTRERPERLGIRRLINPAKYEKTAGIYRMRPYDPDRVPLLMVHGLMDTPATWTPMLNALRADPIIRKKYQIWMFSYPSGYPYPYSAELLRKELNKMKAAHPGHKPIVYVGHSMGGVIGRLMLVDSGNKIWSEFFKLPPNEIKLSPENLAVVRDALIFEHRHDIGRAIFISAPHRGSKLAMGFIGWIGSNLVRAPANLVKLSLSLADVVVLDSTEFKAKHIPNSIDTLSPENRFAKLTMELPMAHHIPYHTICGDRGRGGAPNCSDGVVPYSSSHLDGAESELIVPSNHGAHQNPQGIQEVRRILRKHIGAPQPQTAPQTGEATSRR
ncbi:MAG: esterase/lipase family protein [Verrucomicrobium sp.]